MSNFRPSFLTISIPDLDWLHELIHGYNRESDLSISHHLVVLVGEDLNKRKLLSVDQWKQIKQLHGTKTRSTEQKKFKNLSWYIPQQVLEWLPDKIKEVAKSRSFYVWNLFVRAHKSSIPARFLAEWGDPDLLDMSASRVQIKRSVTTINDIEKKIAQEQQAHQSRLASHYKHIEHLKNVEESKKKSRPRKSPDALRAKRKPA